MTGCMSGRIRSVGAREVLYGKVWGGRSLQPQGRGRLVLCIALARRPLPYKLFQGYFTSIVNGTFRMYCGHNWPFAQIGLPVKLSWEAPVP